VDGFNTSVPSKVSIVECENALDAMHPHCRDKTRVVDLDARDAVRYQEFPPLLVNGEAVRQQAELPFEGPCQSVCLFRREAVAIAIYWASTGVPKFADILGRIAKNAIMPKNGIGG
jgi:hypothetical protein